MPDETQVGEESLATTAPAKKTAAKKAAAKKAPAKKAAAKKATAKKAAPVEEPAAPPVDSPAEVPAEAPTEEPTEKPVKKTAAKKTAARKAPAKRATKKAAAAPETTDATVDPAPVTESAEASGTAMLFQVPETAPAEKPAKKTAAKKSAAKKTTAKKSAAKKAAAAAAPVPEVEDETEEASVAVEATDAPVEAPVDAQVDVTGPAAETTEDTSAATEADSDADDDSDTDSDTDDGEGSGAPRRRRRRGGRRRRKAGDATDSGDSGDSGDSSESGDAGEGADGSDSGDSTDAAGDTNDADDSPSEGGGTSRRRRRRRRSGEDGGETSDDPENTVTRVRKQRSSDDEITAISGSTRLEAKKQRRREGREAGRRRAPIVSEAEFLARRESVDRVMVVRQRDELTQIGVLEDRVLVEHYVARESQTSLIGNVYLGRVQNVLPSMEAAFIDIGKGRNAVLYAGEVNWSALGHKDGQPRKIESVLSSGQTVLVQVTKDPIGHKGARLTSQISLAGRFLVYVPDGTTSGISRKLPDTERNRLKTLLKEIVPDSAGVIVRTAAEGASEEELTRDVERLKARWEDIEGKARGNAPSLLYGEPDLTLKVVRDLFTEDFSKLVIQGDDAWETVRSYVSHVAPDLEERLERYEPGEHGQHGKADVFAEYRIDEQIAKGLDRKVWLPSGGSLIIDRTEAMTVVDVNTGKFTGSGGNLEETVTKNNLEAAEEIVRQLRLRDIGGIIVVDFIDMVLESNRDLVLRRLVECLGRDRTRHQVAEVTSLGLVQMTRKRIGTGLVEAFSENCEHCQGRGVVIHQHPVEPKGSGGGGEDESRRGGRRNRGRGRGGDQDSGSSSSGNGNGNGNGNNGNGGGKSPSPKDVAAMARAEQDEAQAVDAPAEVTEPTTPTAEPVVEEAATVAETPAGAETPVVEEPVVEEPAAPKVTTRTRGRRSASRPATSEPTPEPVVEPVVETAPQPEAPVTTIEAPAEVTVEEPPAPKVTTRTRTRRATRPAGPPADEPASSGAGVGSVASGAGLGSVGSVGVPPQDGIVEPGTAGSEPGAATEGEPMDDDAHVEHVPIKKKGSRKR